MAEIVNGDTQEVVRRHVFDFLAQQTLRVLDEVPHRRLGEERRWASGDTQNRPLMDT